MRYRGTLIAVTDLERSIRFYREVLGLGVEADFGASVMLEGGIFLQTLDTWKKFIGEKRVEFQHNSSELYFEQRDMENYLRHLETQEVSLVHPPMVHSWARRQSVFTTRMATLLRWQRNWKQLYPGIWTGD